MLLFKINNKILLIYPLQYYCIIEKIIINYMPLTYNKYILI